MADEIDLDDVVISQQAFQAWRQFAKSVVTSLVHSKESHDIPDERARINPDGSLTIFVAFPGEEEVSMKIPPGDWTPRKIS